MRIQQRERAFVPSKRSGMLAFSLFVFSSLILLVQTSSSSHIFDPDINLFGDAHAIVSDGTTRVALTRPSPSSSGLLLRRKSFPFSHHTSFSTHFSFSVSPAAGDGLILVLVPGDFSGAFRGNDSFGVSLDSKYVAVEFDTSKDDNVGDVNANHVGIDVGSLVSVAVANVSSVNLVLNSGEKLNAWVDYEGRSKVLEVRLSKWGEPRSSLPIVSHSIDLFEIWGRNTVFVGISSSNGANSVQVVSVYSWKFSLGKISSSLHSLPADPRNFSDHGVNDEKNKFCTLTVLARVIFGTGCVALVTFMVLFMWVIFFQRREEESLVKIPGHPVRYERIDVAVEKNAGDDES
ncbi:L-type lectin-domain containing receptor kinase VIII.2-like [Abrus precatorius]|uniref:L-type lectin-domain containing receptor kinase VIII.2-like n=1 Tax=Abrus precatorius TaxID=3816 RepID=A0A8B8JUX2_ABRPR|nr:L-type lectin-domain containing receptor kinase VIII.2-like [Abrus precatorius]